MQGRARARQRAACRPSARRARAQPAYRTPYTREAFIQTPLKLYAPCDRQTANDYVLRPCLLVYAYDI